jgi:predicted nucleic acid-binding protein
VIYLDTSVAVAQLFVEDRRPPASLWRERLVSSRLLAYELWTRLHGRRLVRSHGESARELLAQVAFLELSPAVLTRALEPFPTPVRTLDALHLASLDYLRSQRVTVSLATYDARMLAAARRLEIPIEELA